MTEQKRIRGMAILLLAGVCAISVIGCASSNVPTLKGSLPEQGAKAQYPKYLWHRVQQGESWQMISGMYEVPTATLRAENEELATKGELAVGDLLRIPY